MTEAPGPDRQLDLTRPELSPSFDPQPEPREILGVRFHASRYEQATKLILRWALRGESRTVYCSNTHSVIEAQDDPAFHEILNTADLNTSDGVPIVWALRREGVGAERVYGPDLTLHVLQAAAEQGLPVAFYGSTPETLSRLRETLPELVPGIDLCAMISPPFRPLSEEEDEAFTRELVESGARIVFVGLGCPRQERWCDAHRGRIPAPMLGVGAAFDFHAGQVRQAPSLIQKMGMEWAFRLAMEPRRLWRRYTRVVPRFLIGYGRQMMRSEGA
ncbi:MAG: WecB/TagA/CpsF family glycosyltransferase [Rubricoccaceae bacterium]